MRLAWAPAVAVIAACYGPSVSPGAPCGPNDVCPSGLDCIGGFCLPPGTMTQDDAAVQDDADVMIDGSMVTIDGPVDAAVYVPWGTPVAVPSLNAVSGSGEGDPTFTSNKLTAMVTSNSPDDIFECTRPAIGQAFTCFVLAINSVNEDQSPELSPDGSTLYFTSNRSGSYDIYMSTKTGGVWSTPTTASGLTSASSDGDVAISPDGLTAVVERSNHFVFYTRASTAVPFANPVMHTELEITTDIAAPTITNNGNVIYFHIGSTRDIVMATRKGNGTYNTPVPVTELNTSGRDAAPFVSADDKYMLFERGGDIYETSRP